MSTAQRPGLGIGLILVAMIAISVNDLLIKMLSGGYPLHQMVFFRSFVGLLVSLVIVQFEGGWSILRTTRPGLHALRGLLVVLSNMTFFAALAVLPLGEATALFFVAPLFITLLSIPVLGEKVGPWRMGAVLAGFAGVVIMQRPWAGGETLEVSRAVLLLPVIAAALYAGMQVMTRKLGATAKASALAVYIQCTFIVVSLAVYAVAGDGRLAARFDSPAMEFLLRAWIWPEGTDRWLFLGLGVNSAIVGYTLSQAYRLASAATIAPFEYVGLPIAIFWGWLIFGEWPAPAVWAGIALILGAGLFVFFRERVRARPVPRARPPHRRY